MIISARVDRADAAARREAMNRLSRILGERAGTLGEQVRRLRPVTTETEEALPRSIIRDQSQSSIGGE